MTTPSPGNIFVAHGDLTQISCDAVALSTSAALKFSGAMCKAFDDAFQVKARFAQTYPTPGKPAVGRAFWLPLETTSKPYGIVVAIAVGTSCDHQSAGLAVAGFCRFRL